MKIKETTKKFVKDHKYEIIETAAVTIAVLATYTFVCGRLGYRMSKPVAYDEMYIISETISGKRLAALKIPYTQ